MNQIKMWWIWLKHITGKHELKRLGAFHTVTLTDFNTAVGRLHMHAYSDERDARHTARMALLHLHKYPSSGTKSKQAQSHFFPIALTYTSYTLISMHKLVCSVDWLHLLVHYNSCEKCSAIYCYNCNWRECRRWGALFISAYVQWIVMSMS